jgi:membrane associated rhomboid family serine protease
LPLSDRDYMRPNQPQRPRRINTAPSLSLNPLLVLIVINVVFYFATLVAPTGQYPWGTVHVINMDRITYYLGLIPYYVADRPWTIITAMFLHANFTHILFNMIALFFFGRTLRWFVGDNRFLLVYFIGGIIGNLAFWGLNAGELSIAVGASGAIFALAGALVVIQPRMRIFFWGIIPMQLWLFVVIFMGILSIPGIAPSGIAWQAHLGGLVSGLAIGWFFRRRLRLFVI